MDGIEEYSSIQEIGFVRLNAEWICDKIVGYEFN